MKVIIKKTQRILDDFFKVDRSLLQIEKFDGTFSQEMVRLNFIRGDAAAAILFNPIKKTVILVKQFRFPVYTKDGQHAWIYEIVAGMIDNDSSPEETIIREIDEETGYRVNEVKSLFTFYPTPGGSNEKIFLFLAEVNENDRKNKGGGVESENEDIEVVELPVDTVFEKLDNNQFMDAKTIISLQWLKTELTK